MVDRVTAMEVGARIEGTKCWSMSDDVFTDHFPGVPTVPGVFLVESMAQLVGFLLEATYRQRFGDEQVGFAILSIIHKAKFRKFVVPGETVAMEGELISMDRKRASCNIRGRVDGELRAEATLSFVMFEQKPDEMPPELKMQRDGYARFVLAHVREPESSAAERD